MKNRLLNLHKLADRMVIGAALVFVVVVALLAATLMRQAALRQAVSSSGAAELRENVEELREAVDQLRTEVPAVSAGPEELAAIDQQLSELGEQLESMEQVIEGIAPVLEEIQPTLASTDLPPAESVEAIQGEIHWLFTAAAWLIGATSVVTAVIAYVVLNPRSRERRRRAAFQPPERLPLAPNDPEV